MEGFINNGRPGGRRARIPAQSEDGKKAHCGYAHNPENQLTKAYHRVELPTHGSPIRAHSLTRGRAAVTAHPDTLNTAVLPRGYLAENNEVEGFQVERVSP